MVDALHPNPRRFTGKAAYSILSYCPWPGTDLLIILASSRGPVILIDVSPRLEVMSAAARLQST